MGRLCRNIVLTGEDTVAGECRFCIEMRALAVFALGSDGRQSLAVMIAHLLVAVGLGRF